jgi:ABC-type phosphate/phosphonate transport system substrate-binding protein
MSTTLPNGFAILRAQHLLGYQTRFRATCTHIGAAIGIDLEPHTARDYGELTKAFEAGSLGLAWVPPVTAARLVRRNLVVPLALPLRRGRAHYRSVIVAHEDAPEDLASYRSPRVAWVDPESAAGYLAARGPLQEHLASGFASEQFLGSHSAVVDAVAIRAVDLGASFGTFDDATGELVEAEWLDAAGVKLRPVKAIASFGAIPNDCLVVSTLWPRELQERARSWFLSAPRGELDIVADLLRTGQLVPVDDAWQAGVDRVLAAARSHGLPELGSRRSHDVKRPRS